MAVSKYMSRIIAGTEMDLGDNDDRFRSSVQAALHVSSMWALVIVVFYECYPSSTCTQQNHTYGITSDPLTQFACLFAALIHDGQYRQL